LLKKDTRKKTCTGEGHTKQKTEEETIFKTGEKRGVDKKK